VEKELTMEDCAYTSQGKSTVIPTDLETRKEIRVSYKSETINFELEAGIQQAMNSISYQKCASYLYLGERILIFTFSREF